RHSATPVPWQRGRTAIPRRWPSPPPTARPPIVPRTSPPGETATKTAVSARRSARARGEGTVSLKAPSLYASRYGRNASRRQARTSSASRRSAGRTEKPSACSTVFWRRPPGRPPSRRRGLARGLEVRVQEREDPPVSFDLVLLLGEAVALVGEHHVLDRDA